MGKNLADKIEKENSNVKKISLDTPIKEFAEIIGHKEYKGSVINRKGLGQLPIGIYLTLKEIAIHVDTIGDLKKMAENADGFARLKNGAYFNDGKCLPYRALRCFGEGKLKHLNKILSEYEIKPIPWITRKYNAWERKKEKGEDWYEHLKI